MFGFAARIVGLPPPTLTPAMPAPGPWSGRGLPRDRSLEVVLMWEDRGVEDEVQRRVAANEAALRKVNEAIERGEWLGEEGERVGFRCECASPRP